MLLFAIGLIFFAGAVAMVARAVLLPRLRVSSQLDQIKTYGFNPGSAEASQAVKRPLMLIATSHLAERIGRSVGGRGAFAPVEPRTLRAAGIYAVTAEAFQGYRVMAAAGVPGFLLLVTLLGGNIKATGVLLIIACATIVWVLPPVSVRTRAQRRMDAVDRTLPELVDVLTATVEAGLGFAGSLQLVSSRFRGPLGQELRAMIQEQGLGLSAEQALSNMVDRCDTASVRAFARTIVQGETLGVSIGAMLRNLAAETRKKRRQAAREQILKAPVKMLFPLVLLIFPSLMIVLLYPAVHNILKTFGH
jgi:tight adherence protein C